MTECSRSSIEFGGCAGRRLLADFEGGRLTSDGGVLLLRAVDQKIGLIDAICECIPDPRNPIYTRHDQRTMLAQRIMGIALGYEDLNDHQTLRDDPALMTATDTDLNRGYPLSSPSTLCRLENRVTTKAMFEMSGVLVDQFLNAYEEAPEEIVRTVRVAVGIGEPREDVSVRREHPAQRGAETLVRRRDRRVGRKRKVVELRPGVHQRVDVQIVGHVHHAGDEGGQPRRCIVRGDSGFCRWRFDAMVRKTCCFVHFSVWLATAFSRTYCRH